VLQDGGEFVVWNVANVELQEAIAERFGQDL
jgi:hypothetical protein